MYISKKPILESNSSKRANFLLKGSKYGDTPTVTLYIQSRLSDVPCLDRITEIKFSTIGVFFRIFVQIDLLLVIRRQAESSGVWVLHDSMSLCPARSSVVCSITVIFFCTSHFKFLPLFSHKVAASIGSWSARKQSWKDRSCRVVAGDLLYSPANSYANFRISLCVQLNRAQVKIFKFQKMYIYFSYLFLLSFE